MEEAGVDILNPMTTIEESRERLAKWVKVMYGRPIQLREVTDIRIEGALGPIPVRIYKPLNQKRDAPIVVYFRGGGWILGDLDTDDESARLLCKLSGAVAVSVDYRPRLSTSSQPVQRTVTSPRSGPARTPRPSAAIHGSWWWWGTVPAVTLRRRSASWLRREGSPG